MCSVMKTLLERFMCNFSNVMFYVQFNVTFYVQFEVTFYVKGKSAVKCRVGNILLYRTLQFKTGIFCFMLLPAAELYTAEHCSKVQFETNISCFMLLLLLLQNIEVTCNLKQRPFVTCSSSC